MSSTTPDHTWLSAAIAAGKPLKVTNRLSLELHLNESGLLRCVQHVPRRHRNKTKAREVMRVVNVDYALPDWEDVVALCKLRASYLGQTLSGHTVERMSFVFEGLKVGIEMKLGVEMTAGGIRFGTRLEATDYVYTWGTPFDAATAIIGDYRKILHEM